MVWGWPGIGKQIAESALTESARARVVKIAVVNCIVDRLVDETLLCWKFKREALRWEQIDVYIYLYMSPHKSLTTVVN